MTSDARASALAIVLQRPGGYLVALASLSLATFSWMVASVYVPIARERLEYVFVSASTLRFGVSALVALVTLSVIHVFLRRLEPSALQPPCLSFADARYLTPLLTLAVAALPLAGLALSRPDVLSVVWYVAIDLRWWWASLASVWYFVEVDRRLQWTIRKTIREYMRGLPGMAPALALAVIAASWVAGGTPSLRYSGAKVGDESKYVRYCENLYQGHGFEISLVQPIGALGRQYRPRLWANMRLAAATIPAVLRDLASSTRWLRLSGEGAKRVNGDFIIGRHGGLFQMHLPGLPLLMFPAYYFDRRVAALDPGSTLQWPEDLPRLSIFLLSVYVAWVLLLFAFVRRHTESTSASWVATATVMLTFPVAAFPFQVYPEVAAGLLLLIPSYMVSFPKERWCVRWLFAGVCVGYLPWLHVRFSGAAAIMFAGMLFVLSAQKPRKMGWFAAGAIAPVVILALYTVHMTGSIWPMSVYYVQGQAGSPLSIRGVLINGIGYLIDRDWGLFPHAPVYLFALPGVFWVMKRRRILALPLVASLAIFVTAAAFSLRASDTTPLRLIVSAVPIVALPLAEVLVRYGRRPPFQVAYATLLVLSLFTALAYNLHHQKDRLLDASISGWKPNLLFPAESRWPWEISTANAGLAGLWVLLIAAFACAPWIRWPYSARRVALARPPRDIYPRLAVRAVASLVLAGTVVAIATDVYVADRYLMTTAQAAVEVSNKLDTLSACALCAVSGRGLMTKEELTTYLR